MGTTDYSDVVFSVHDTGDHIVRERPRRSAGAWTLFVLVCLVYAAAVPVTTVVLMDVMMAGHGLGTVALWAGPPAVVALAGGVAVNAMGEWLTGRSSAGTRLMLGLGLLGFGGALTAPLRHAWSDHSSNVPVLIGAAFPGSVALAGAILTGRGVVLARGAMRRQAGMRELRARGRRDAGVLESVRFLKSWPSSLPEFEVVVGYGAGQRLTARLVTDPERVPLPGARLWVHTVPGGSDALIELDGDGPVAFDPRADEYRQPCGDGGGGGA
ncbi:hypothetical protein [Jiangella sp. DSM 45060]|uniref:hypothetical protein n=1 Tax=Jiangella sp. DSM 45060 TaxID=1798224 RepID=UPI00087CAC80|nr:hypothetical protein [Jiangella sp. DSM 45060]SDT30702.1 hypothetical protein SAMN04515669_3484 [Jiangella sp. DSM 45060]